MIRTDKFWKDINKIEVNFENYGPAEEFYGYSDSDFDYSTNYLHENLPILMTKSGVPYLCCSGSDAGMQQLGDVEISDCAYSSENFGDEYDDEGNVTRWCEYGECSKGDIIFDSY